MNYGSVANALSATNNSWLKGKSLAVVWLLRKLKRNIVEVCNLYVRTQEVIE